MIRQAVKSDAPQLTAIYNYYILNDISTFEEKEILENEMQKRLLDSTMIFPWLVYSVDQKIMGYAYASIWKARSAYKFSAQCSVYLDPTARGKGIGSKLYAQLFSDLKAANFNMVMAGISLPNEASVKIHEKFGFIKAAHFKEIGYKFGKWIDVGYWQLKLQE